MFLPYLYSIPEIMKNIKILNTQLLSVSQQMYNTASQKLDSEVSK